MKAFLFYWQDIKLNLQNGYTLVYADDIEEAYKKLSDQINPTQITYEIRLATII